MWSIGFNFLLLLSAVAAEGIVEKVPAKVNILEHNVIFNHQPYSSHRGFVVSDLHTYCYKGTPKTLARLFETDELFLDIANDDYTQYEGATPEEVQQHYDEHRSLFSFTLFNQKRPYLQLSPFVERCIGIETSQRYRVKLQQQLIDFYRVILLGLGIALFKSADRLSHNALFYYITGVTLGICSSFMLLIWLTSKLMPGRTMMYGMLVGGWTMGIYILQLIKDNLQLIVLTYRTYVFWYIVVTGLISFFFCYRLGPPKDDRSKNIVKWLLQIASVLMIYFSSHFEEATVAIMFLTALLHYFPMAWWRKMRSWYKRRFPPPRRYLTNEEYYEQGVRETTKALDELRGYVSSPECKQWRVMTKLKDPKRFAAFVEGASHLRDDEILRFEVNKYSDEGDTEDEREENDEQDIVLLEDNISEDDEDDGEHRNVIRGRRSLSRGRNGVTPLNYVRGERPNVFMYDSPSGRQRSVLRLNYDIASPRNRRPYSSINSQPVHEEGLELSDDNE